MFIYNFILYALFFKQNDFSIENEYRMIVGNFGNLEDKYLEFNIKNGIFVPYISYNLSKDKSVDGRVIEKIIASPTSNEKLMDFSLNKLCLKYGYQAMSFAHSKLPLQY